MLSDIFSGMKSTGKSSRPKVLKAATRNTQHSAYGLSNCGNKVSYNDQNYRGSTISLIPVLTFSSIRISTNTGVKAILIPSSLR